MIKAVLMCMQLTWLEISPARCQMLEELAACGYETYLFFNGNLTKRSGFPYVHHVINTRGMACDKIRSKIREIAPQIVIASTCEDMKSVYFLPWTMRKTDFYYYNLEIYTPYVPESMKQDDFEEYVRAKISYPFQKLREMLYVKKVKAFTIQDELRKKISAKYHIKHKNTILIPNSYIFNEQEISIRRGKGIVYTGAVARWALEDQLSNLEKVKNVNVTFVGRIDPKYKKQIGKLRRSNPNLVFAEQQLMMEEYTKYLQQYAVGLVWYSPSRESENVYYMGLSSGKMFKCLSLGMPVIVVGQCPGQRRKSKNTVWDW